MTEGPIQYCIGYEGSTNEDIVGSAKNFAWAIDGATSLADENITPDETEAKWFSNTVHRYLNNIVAEEDDPESINIDHLLKEAVDKTREDFSQFGNLDEIELYEQPAATIVLVKICEKRIEYRILADAYLITRDIKDITVYVDETVEHLDKVAIKMINKLQTEYDMSHYEARMHEKVRERLREQRKRFNRIQGYRVLSLDPEIVDKAKGGSIQLTRPNDLILATDGFAHLVETMEVYPTWLEVFEALDDGKEFRTLFEELREAEKADDECLEHPRVKQHDDAGAIYFKDVSEGDILKDEISKIVKEAEAMNQPSGQELFNS